MPTKTSTPPWKKKPPPRPTTKLSPASVAAARARALAAGRTYPNLVDNMWAAKQQRTKQR